LGEFKKALALRPDYPQAWNGVGLFYVEKKAWQQAISSFQKALEMQPNFVDALNNLGRCFQIIGRKDRAICLFQQALAIEPDDPGILNNLGLALARALCPRTPTGKRSRAKSTSGFKVW